MKIRIYVEADRSSVITLWRESGLVVPWNDPDKDIDRKLSVDPNTFFVGELAGELMASMMVGFDGHRGWINYLAVSSKHQRRGYATALVRQAEKVLIEVGCPKLNLQVRGTNQQVVQFYEALGYINDNAVSLGKRLIPDI
ncbi:MAG: GNAT family acetyltransferase [Acidiferrobacterales bacterium]|nr:GNAT family acetyltransferase [Acidiferrobacterales bacterium]